MTIAQYKIVFSLRKGSYFEIFRVVDEQKNKYLLKLINLAKLDRLQYNDDMTLVYETDIAKNLSHPNISKQMDCGETIMDGQRYVYVVYDFIPGETLADKMARETVCSVYDTRQIITGILNALKYLHSLQMPIIHNGISPWSVMLDLSGVSVKSIVSDFGNACLLDNLHRKSFIGNLSPFYLAPEVFNGLYSTRTDLYSVGALMYHVIFGREPWFVDLSSISASKKQQTVLDARKQLLPIPNIHIHELDDQLLAVMAKALAQDVDKRFQSADEFLRALNGENKIRCDEYKKVEIEIEKEEEVPKPAIVKKGNGFADVAGMSALKQRLQEEVIDLIQNPEKFRRLRVQIPNGVLLYGPPGCGKTFVAEKFAEELGCNYMYIHCSDVASPYIHGGQEKIAAIFKQARENAPTVLFLDELDAMIANRDHHKNVSESGEVNEFLTQLNNCADQHIIVIGATNNPQALAPAALRSGRLDIKVYVPAPNKEERRALFELSLKDIAAEDVDYDKLAQMTEGFVSKDICSLVNKAALASARQDKDSIDMTALTNAFECSKGELPSVSSAVLKMHEQIRIEFEHRKDSHRPIGFNILKE